MQLRLDRYASVLSEILLVTDRDGVLRALEFADLRPRMVRLLKQHYGDHSLREAAAPAGLRRALDAYFAGEPDALRQVPTATGGTAFQRQVWAALRQIPAGETRSYGELAAAIGRAGSARAVGAANGANPIPLVVPCHRVIGANGTLVGFAGGVVRKRWLLEHERRFRPLSTAPASPRGQHVPAVAV